MAAAMFGGISSHAGLFGNAINVAKVMQMYLQDGNYANQQILKSKTINLFNNCYYCDEDNRRGVGFDKPQLEKEGPTRLCNVQEENARAIRSREFAQNKAAQAASIGDVADTKKFLKELIEMGNDEENAEGQEGGARGSKRKLAAHCAEIFARSTRICASKLQENKE